MLNSTDFCRPNVSLSAFISIFSKPLEYLVHYLGVFLSDPKDNQYSEGCIVRCIMNELSLVSFEDGHMSMLKLKRI